LKNVLGMLKGSNRYETAENYSLTGVLIGVVMLCSGLGLAALTPVGVPVVLAMLGSLIAFLFTVILLLVWIAKSYSK